MRFRFLPLCLCALAALFFTAGCERLDTTPLSAEVDEPAYRRGKELLRQGRSQEALASFLKVIEKRGDDAPESHLELGILYQRHIKDPLAAIYHYRKFRELKPNSPQSDLVRQQIDAATRDFARTLPAQPLENQLGRLDLIDKVTELERANEQLRLQLGGSAPRPLAVNNRPPAQQPPAPLEDLAPLAVDPNQSPIVLAPPDEEAPPFRPVETTTPTTTIPPVASNTRTVTPQPRPQQQTPAPAGRRHVVIKGDTLFILAQKYYGNRSRWREIYAANRNVLPSEQSPLRIGMELKIP